MKQKIFTYTVPVITLSFILIRILIYLKIYPKEGVLVFFGTLVLALVVLFFYVLYLNLTYNYDNDGASEQNIIENNKSLPVTTYEAKPHILRRLLFYIYVVLIGYILSLTIYLSIGFFVFLFSMLLFVLFLTGTKFISYMEFTTTGIVFYTRLFNLIGFGGRFFLPYEKCHVSFFSGFSRSENDESIIFSKGKLPYVMVSMSSWDNSWDEIKSELERRLPDNRLPK